ncbi:MAG: hypothetical protein ACLSHC_07220 [Bilophila wadsworthia]
MNLTRQHLLTVADRIAIIELLRNLMNPRGERSKLLTRHLRRAVLDFQASTGWPSSIAWGTVIVASIRARTPPAGKLLLFPQGAARRTNLDGRLSFLYAGKGVHHLHPIYDRAKYPACSSARSTWSTSRALSSIPSPSTAWGTFRLHAGRLGHHAQGP